MLYHICCEGESLSLTFFRHGTLETLKGQKLGKGHAEWDVEGPQFYCSFFSMVFMGGNI